MSYLVAKYLGFASSRLRNFKRRSPELFNFSCPYCGDSRTRKRVARAYIFRQREKHLFYCHNCGKCAEFGNFLKHFDPSLYSEYLAETMVMEAPEPPRAPKATQPPPQGFLAPLPPVSTLRKDDLVRRYAESRLLPERFWPRLYRCDRFFGFCQMLAPAKFEKLPARDETRMLIPLADRDGDFGFTGRAMGKSDVKYVTVILRDGTDKAYGLDRVDPKSTVHVVEGPIDSMFLENCVATCGGVLAKARQMKEIAGSNMVFVPDRDTANAEVMTQVERLIDNDEAVCLLPYRTGCKDMNDFARDGLDATALATMVAENTFRGMELRLRYGEWRRGKG